MKPTACAPARLPRLLCLPLAALALALGGCGSGSAAPGKSTTATVAAPAGAQHAQVRPSGCGTQLGGFLGSLESLRRRLVVGLSYEQYVAAVGEIKAAYARVPAARLSLGCLIESGTPAERAFNEYIDAANAWGECLAEAGCRAATIEATLQRRWRLASRLLPKR